MKNTHPKIYIFCNGRFIAFTTCARTCQDALSSWHDAYGYVSNEVITAHLMAILKKTQN